MRHKLYSKGAKSIGNINVSPRWVRIIRNLGKGVGILAIVNLGLQGVLYLLNANYYGHKNYFNQDVGTLLIISIMVTFVVVGIYKGIERIKLRNRRTHN